MEKEILLQLLLTEPEKAVEKIRATGKNIEEISKYQKEYKQHDRSVRDTQVANIQKDKMAGTGTKKRLVKAVRIPINFPKKIVTTSVSFEVGKPVTLVPSEDNNLSKLIAQLWKVNRIDSLIQKLVLLKKSETQGALQLYIKDIGPSSILSKMLAKIGIKSQAKEIKSKLLDNNTGKMTPFFDASGNMTLFMWEYSTFNSEGKEIINIEIWDEKNCHKLSTETGKLAYSDTPKPHGFDRIPIVYVSQDEPEWFDVKELIDRLETTLSKLGASNDYTAYPLLQIFGEIKSFPEKDDTGKVLHFPIKVDEDTNKPIHGKAEFLTANNSVDRSKLEIESLLSLVYSISNTPNTSFDNVKGIGSVSGVAMKLMFLDAIIKAYSNEGDNRTMIERIINIMIGGVITTTNQSLSKEATTLYFDVIFNSILPDDLKELVETTSTAVQSGIMSKKTAVGKLNQTDDNASELEEIKNDKSVVA
ncbi:phage portal protein [Flavobacterium oreochromis]|uniref:phage portal protein n=1 Tax=Flavobacterium oreochromis TaxID=2906078 RepID=UPI001CE63B26|nr:phage portal protein [Flavobacterium oreochromis]QYS85417.1 phage portal protein [Flavobacterium oreochromis]